ncbi:MAG TPA: FAD-binding oxidoreductase [Solirubrobacteraceae bacterium]
MATAVQQAPRTHEEAAAALAAASAEGLSVRIVGGATKLGWGHVTDPAAIELHTSGLDRILEHNAGDLTAELEAGVRLAEAQRAFAEHGQMLALDPPLGGDPGATIGGIVATGDCGPLAHRYGGPRDLVVGARLALSDGTIAHSGGKVIKNVAGYDLAKLFVGSFGTLGLILSVNVRLHAMPAATTTALGSSGDCQALAAAALGLSSAPLELAALDVAWRGGQGGLLARCDGPQARRRGERAARLMADLGLERTEVTADDQGLWERQRAGQRSSSQALVRISTRPSTLASLLRAADACAGTVVGRAALGSIYVELDPDAVGRLREELPPGTVSTVLDAPPATRAELDPWGPAQRPAIELMRRVKMRFDATGTCNPGLFVDRI